MKLNNRGWSLREMLFFMLILIVCLLIATFYLFRLYSQLDSDKENFVEENKIEEIKNEKNYEEYEKDLKKSARHYIENLYEGELSSQFVISITELKEENLLTEYSDYNCKGYITVFENNEEYDYKPYLNCDDYKTKDYNELYE